jgi:putative transposase
VQILQEQAGGVVPVELIRRHGISMDTLYRWRRKYRGVTRAEVQRLKALEEENRRLKRLVVEQALNAEVLKNALGSTW